MKRIISVLLVLVLALTACGGQAKSQDDVVSEILAATEKVEDEKMGLKVKGNMDMASSKATMEVTADKDANTYLKMSLDMSGTPMSSEMGEMGTQNVELFVTGNKGYVKQGATNEWIQAEGISKDTLMKSTMVPGNDQVKALEETLKKAKMTEENGVYVFDMEVSFADFVKSTQAQNVGGESGMQFLKTPIKMVMKFDKEDYRLAGFSFDGTEAINAQMQGELEGMSQSGADFRMVGNFDIEYIKDESFKLQAPEGLTIEAE